MATRTDLNSILQPQKRNFISRQMQIKCLQINLKHSRTATSNLTQIITENNIDIIFLQEPYTHLNNVAGFPKSYKIFSSGNGRKRSAIILTNDSIDGIAINQISDEDAIVLEFSYKKLKFYGTSMYFDIERDIKMDIERVERIMNYTKGNGLIIAIDSNARSKLWYDISTNQRGKTLEDFVTTSELFLMNEPTGIPTFETIRGRSWIDLTLCNGKIAATITDWTNGKDESCSDHKIISFNIVMRKQDYREIHYIGKRYYTREEDYKKFESVLTTNLLSKFKCSNIHGDSYKYDEELRRKVYQSDNNDEVVEKLTQSITAACDAAFKVSRPRKHISTSKSVPWWTQELTILRKKVVALRRRYQRTTTDDSARLERRLKYQEENRNYQAKIREEKLKSWKIFCSQAGSNPWNAVYRLAAGKLRNKSTLTTLQTPDGMYTTDITSTITHMIEHFTPEDKESSDTLNHKQARLRITEPMNTPDDKDFTLVEIESVLKKFNSTKAPGEDGLSSEIMLRVLKLFPKFFTEVYNECLRKGCFPKQWKRSTIIPVIKPGKEDSSEVTKYRPISLLNVGGKLLEKLLIDRIYHHVFSKNLLNINQYGFCPQKNTVDAALAAKEFVINNLKKKKYVIFVSLDVRGAFDSAWWPSILNNLRELQCPKNLFHLSKDYFRDRKATLCVNTQRVDRDIQKGCPQGSCCGPGFWNVMYNGLLNLNYSRHTKLIAFADDVAVITEGDSLAEAEMYSNADMAKIEKWAKNNRIEFNNSKSKAMTITRKKTNRAVNIYINNKAIEVVDIIKYLGIYFDSKLLFNKHIEVIAERATTLVNMLSRSAKLQWGLGYKSLKTIYEGAIIPMLTYGAPVWEEAIRKRKNLLKLQRVQRLINIKIAKAHKTLSYEASCVMAGVLPIELVIEEKVELYKIKHGYTRFQYECELPLPVKDWPHPAERVNLTQTNDQARYGFKIYTDGSKTGENVGSGIAIFTDNNLIGQFKYRLENHCSNNQAEKLAILKAIEKIQSLPNCNDIDKTIAIYTDSKVTLDSINNNHIHCPLSEQFRDKLRELTKGNWIIHVGWVKAHIGIEGNELADKLAKEAAANNELPIEYGKMPITSISTEQRRRSLSKWQSQWANTTKGSLCRTFFPTVEQRGKMKIPCSPEFTAIVTGHGKTKSYLHRFKILENPTCPCNLEEQTSEHLIYRCTILHQQRRTMQREICASGGKWPTTHSDLIQKHLHAFRKFIKTIDFSII